jgi:hypothetical protein
MGPKAQPKKAAAAVEMGAMKGNGHGHGDGGALQTEDEVKNQLVSQPRFDFELLWLLTLLVRLMPVEWSTVVFPRFAAI